MTHTPHHKQTQDYGLHKDEVKVKRTLKANLKTAREFLAFVKGDGKRLSISFVLVIISSISTVLTPYLVALAIDTYITNGNLPGLLSLLYKLGGLYLITVVVGYYQAIIMGQVSQNILWRLRNTLFDKLQALPIAFFNQNKAGDLMSRLNNDTDKLNQFLSESVMRFVGGFFVLLGIGAFVIYIHPKLGLTMLSMTLVLIVITQALSPWIKRQNKKNLNAIGAFSGALQENLTNFRVIAAYSKRDYFRNYLKEGNQKIFDTSLHAGSANRAFEPIYDLAGAASLIMVLFYGLHLVSAGSLTIGLLVAFLTYTQRFYDPLRTIATIFGAIQMSLAAWARIRAVITMETNLVVIPDESGSAQNSASTQHPPLRMELQNVSFGYFIPDVPQRYVLENVNLSFEVGKTYALVGPTGGGKSTLASVMARLYDPLAGNVMLDGKDIKTYTASERAERVSVILQDPILFTGTVADNIRYGNTSCEGKTDADLEKLLVSEGFKEVISRFPDGLSTPVTQAGGSGLSLGQKQLISFMRIMLREPKLLILDEATANIDTVTEAILTKTLEALPKDTTKIIIAHRLNTIKEADEIMFVNGHHVTRAGNLNEAINLIENSKRTS